MTAPRLPLGVFRAVFTTRESLSLPQWTGSAWRGAFGHALRRTVCVTGARRCEGCLLLGSCPYPRLFEAPLLGGARRPNPYVLIPDDAERPETLGPGQTLGLGLVLVGERAMAMLPYVVHALDRAAERGLTRRPVPLSLDRVEAWDAGAGGWNPVFTPGEPLGTALPVAHPVPPAPERLVVHLRSPLRARAQGRLLRPETLDFSHFFRVVARRIQALAQTHGGEADGVRYPELVQLAHQVHVTQQSLRWVDWARYSSRQRTTMRMGGIVGRFTVAGEALAHLWPWLWLGQWVHAGRSTTMGLGRYRIEADGLPALPWG